MLERAERIRTQQRNSKNKLYALHAPEVECIGKGKARKPYEFGVKTGLLVTHRHGLIAGARTFPGNPYDGHTLAEQLQQAEVLLRTSAWFRRRSSSISDTGAWMRWCRTCSCCTGERAGR
jgi:IS5 family transposase